MEKENVLWLKLCSGPSIEVYRVTELFFMTNITISFSIESELRMFESFLKTNGVETFDVSGNSVVLKGYYAYLECIRISH